MITLCTLFDHNYIDKGLTMYNSLESLCCDFELYVLAMSDKCYEILTDLDYAHLKPIRLSDFEDEELLKVKQYRKVGEYCWTCTPSLILYVINTYHPEYCTYIDADLFFYSDPKIIIDEMKEKKASVQVIGHRFNEKTAIEAENIVGKYCVEFNTFKNDTNGLELLDIWRNQCLEHCSIDGDGIYWGDQKYQDNWCTDYDYVIETDNIGAGIAPWNISQYKSRHGYRLYNKQYNKECDLLFYHFENIKYVNKNIININVPCIIHCDIPFVRSLYKEYLLKVDENKELLLSKYDLNTLITSHPGVDDSNNKKSLRSIMIDFVSYCFCRISLPNTKN